MDARVEKLMRQLSEPQLELFVEGAAAAGRATSKDRIEQISRLVAQGFLAEDISVERERLLLRLLAELTDGEVVTLCSYDTRYRLDPEWWARHKAVIQPSSLLVKEDGEWPWSKHEGWEDAQALEGAREDRLLSLGLLEEKPTMSEADDGGSGGRGYQFEPGHAALSGLGRLLLKEIGPKG